jgi:cytochrome c biogenesis protein CcdA
MELQQLLTLLSESNNNYCFSYLANAQSYLFALGIFIIFMIFVVGGEIFVAHLHKQLYTTKRTLSIISYDILKENPYLSNYLVKNFKTN